MFVLYLTESKMESVRSSYIGTDTSFLPWILFLSVHFSDSNLPHVNNCRKCVL